MKQTSQGHSAATGYFLSKLHKFNLNHQDIFYAKKAKVQYLQERAKEDRKSKQENRTKNIYKNKGFLSHAIKTEIFLANPRKV